MMQTRSGRVFENLTWDSTTNNTANVESPSSSQPPVMGLLDLARQSFSRRRRIERGNNARPGPKQRDRPGPKQRLTFCKLLPHEVSRLMFMKLAPRSQDIWMYWCCKIAQEPERFNGDEFTVDVSQNINRTVPYTDASHCFTGSAEIVLITSQRVLLGYEQMMIQGLSLQLVPHIGNHSNNLLKSLSGNSYALGSAMAALSTLLVAHAVEPVKKYRTKRKAPAD